MLNVAVLVNNIEDLVVLQISEIAKKVRSLKIVTNNIKRFLPLEEVLYCDFGIAVQVTNNKEKAISKEEIIINFDFDKEMLNQYVISKDSTIINIKNPIMTIESNFKGTIINDYNITYNVEIIDEFKDGKDFDDKVLYESLIYRKDTYANIKKQIDKDKVKITELIRVYLD